MKHVSRFRSFLDEDGPSLHRFEVQTVYLPQREYTVPKFNTQSPASLLFTQRFIQAQIKENIKAPRHWSLWGAFAGDWWIPRTKRQ